MYFNAYSSNFKNEIKNKAPIVGERGNRGSHGKWPNSRFVRHCLQFKKLFELFTVR